MQLHLGFPARMRPAVVHLLALLAIAAAFTGATAVSAQQPASYPMTVTQNRVPGASGQVTLTPLGNSQLRVDIQISGLPASPSNRAAHIHTAPGAVCDNNAPVTYPLNNVAVDASGNGTSSTTITLTPDKPVSANNAYVNVHEQASPPGQGVICANLTQTYVAQGAAGMPGTGTGGLLQTQTQSDWLVLAVAGLALLLAGAGAFRLTRHDS